MEWKDWILLVVPIVMNGIILYIFQVLINKKIERKNKRNEVRDEIYLTFIKIIRDLNSCFIFSDSEVRNETDIKRKIEEIAKKVIAVYKYCNDNDYDLKIFLNDTNQLYQAYESFQATIKKYEGQNYTEEIAHALSSKMSLIMDFTNKLLKKVRDAY